VLTGWWLRRSLPSKARTAPLGASPRTPPLEAETLELDPGRVGVVQVLRASYSSEDTPIHTLETICAATRHVFPIGQVAGVDEF
jgi:GntR family transcriptional regulator